MSEQARQKLEELQAAVADWEVALRKLRETVRNPSPLAVTTLNQDESKALIIGILDAFDRINSLEATGG